MSHVNLKVESAVATITLNRPEKLNALVGTMREDLVEALTSAGADRSLRVVVITGEGRGFCAGGDVEAMQELQSRREILEFSKLLSIGATVVTTIRELPQPVIASVNGVAAGAGLNLALACDLRLAADTATFGSTFVRIGLHPDWGGSYFLPRIVGASRALEMMMTGRMIDSEEALRIGLVDRVVPSARLEEETWTLAREIAAGPPIAIQDIKRAVYESMRNELRMQVRLETEHQIRAFLSDDSREGMTAFREKRPPQFSGE
jgi:2-(1,2-epoxy-1,2-dihydrophenyl)acetyl-CoA isomerase